MKSKNPYDPFYFSNYRSGELINGIDRAAHRAGYR